MRSLIMLKPTLTIYILGDFNADNRFWNCAKTDKNGDRFLNSLDDRNLIILNDKSNTRVDFHKSSFSNLDLMIASLNLVDKINVDICEETFGSDHYPVYLNINIGKNVYKRKTFKLQSVRTNWVNFYKEAEENFDLFLTNEYDKMAASEKYEYFTETIKEIIKKNTPKFRFNPNRKKIKNPAAWWNSECDRLKRLKKAAYKKWEFSKKMEDLIEYKITCALATRTFKRTKKDYFKQFAETISFRHGSKYVWDKCRILKNKWIKIKPNHSSQNLQSTHIEKALHKICPPWVSTDPSYTPACPENQFF